MRYPWANVSLFALLLLELATGLAGLLGTSDPFRVLFWLHAVGAYAIFVVLFAKAAVVLDVVRRRPGLDPDRVGLAVMAALLFAVLVTGLVWITSGPHYLLGISLINFHAFLAVALLFPLLRHAFDRRWILRVPASRNRRAFLRFAGVTLAGLALWQAERVAQRLGHTPGSRRRFTGSYERASFSSAFPAVSWLNDDPEPVDAGSWRLAVDGAVERPLSLDYLEFQGMAGAAVTASIDCTGGWYSRQRWDGVPLAHLLETAGLRDGARSVSVESVTGYARRFSLDHTHRLLLATSAAGEHLSHGHGFPARLVVPDRRGFDWVKWVTRVRVLESSHLLQPPLPLS